MVIHDRMHVDLVKKGARLDPGGKSAATRMTEVLLPVANH